MLYSPIFEAPSIMELSIIASMVIIALQLERSELRATLAFQAKHVRGHSRRLEEKAGRDSLRSRRRNCRKQNSEKSQEECLRDSYRSLEVCSMQNSLATTSSAVALKMCPSTDNLNVKDAKVIMEITIRA